MKTHKILWFGQPHENRATFDHSNAHDTSIEYLPTSVSLSSLDSLGQFAAAVISHQDAPEHNFWLLCHLRRLQPTAPLIVLVQNTVSKTIIEAYLTIATDCIESIDLAGLSMLIQRHTIKKVKPKGTKIYPLLQEMGKKITVALQNAQNSYIVPQYMLPKTQEESKPAAAIRVQFFGNFYLYINGKEQACALSKREKSLLAFLLFHHHKSIHRDRLMSRFWGDTAPDSARNSLHVAISKIRRCLEQLEPGYQYISFRNDMYSFNPAVDIESDVAAFSKYFLEARNLEAQEAVEEALDAYHRAFGFYRDSFLVEIEGEDWIAEERHRLQERYLLVLRTLGDYFLKYEQFDFSIRLFEKILEIDDCYEQAYRGLMSSYHSKNRTKEAIRQYQNCVAALAKELNTKPSSETTRLYTFICG